MVDLPAFLAGVERVEATPDVTRAVAEAREDVAAGRTEVYHSDEEFEAALDRLDEAADARSDDRPWRAGGAARC